MVLFAAFIITSSTLLKCRARGMLRCHLAPWLASFSFTLSHFQAPNSFSSVFAPRKSVLLSEGHLLKGYVMMAFKKMQPTFSLQANLPRH